eukprot:TRINITY_DN12039_c0_g1_i1.p1 TRINITY_DN12039_c0_g1~~TRINITY_DN12039_c0_g1_i1.p1  ORF type:complete len:376 (-),score=96.61 TRINITY_DN12039_c0_g1_i1:1137-2264(-)
MAVLDFPLAVARGIRLERFDFFGIPRKRYYQSSLGGCLFISFVSTALLITVWFFYRFLENDIEISQQTSPWNPDKAVDTPQFGIVFNINDQYVQLDAKNFDVVFEHNVIYGRNSSNRVTVLYPGINCTLGSEPGVCMGGKPTKLQGTFGDGAYQYIKVDVKACDAKKDPVRCNDALADWLMFNETQNRTLTLYYNVWAGKQNVWDSLSFGFPGSTTPLRRQFEVYYSPKHIKTKDRYWYGHTEQDVLLFSHYFLRESNFLRTPRSFFNFFIRLSQTWNEEVQKPANFVDFVRNVGGSLSALLAIFALVPRQYNNRFYRQTKRPTFETIQANNPVELYGLKSLEPFDYRALRLPETPPSTGPNTPIMTQSLLPRNH